MNTTDTTTPERPPPRRRRGRGDGSLRQRGDKWVVAVSYIDPATGRRERRTATTTTRHEAKAKLKELQQRLEAGQLADGVDRLTVGQWAARWLETKRASVRPGTFVPYSVHVRQFITPLLGSRKLVQLRRDDVAAFFSALQTKSWMVMGEDGDRTCGPTTAGMTVKLGQTLNMILLAAVHAGVIAANPAAGVARPLHEKKKIRWLAGGDVAKLLAVCGRFPNGALVAVLAAAGLRPGEGRALTWQDVDFDDATLRVRRSVEAFGEVEEFKGTKTGKERVVPIGATALRLLAEHRAENFRTGRTVTPTSLVFQNDTGGFVALTSFYRRTLDPALRAAGLAHVSAYSLRHSCASNLLSLGVSPRTAADQLGHADAHMVLNVYGHSTGEQQRAAADLLDRLYSEPARTGSVG
jgi:integrase